MPRKPHNECSSQQDSKKLSLASTALFISYLGLWIMKRCLKETLLSYCTSASHHSVLWAVPLLLEFLTFDLRMRLFLRLTMQGLNPTGNCQAYVVACTMAVQLGLLTGPGKFQAGCQVAQLSVIHEITKVWINIGSIHACIHNTDDGSCTCQKPMRKWLVLMGAGSGWGGIFFFSFKCQEEEKAIIQEM